MVWHKRWAFLATASFPFALAVLFVVVIPADGATLFTILLKDTGNGASPSEYFDDFQAYFSNPNPPTIQGQKYLSNLDKGYEPVMTELIECDLDPFWEKGAIVSDEKYCPLSVVKLIVWSLVPAICMLFGLLGMWSRQRNVQGRGKETQVGNLISMGLSLLSVSYDWFFSWTLFRSPVGNFQSSLSEVGLAHLIACCVLNFLFMHFWFRRKFLVGMPWYEFHKHGLGLHLIFLLMYGQPQAVQMFQSRLFNVDLFNIHFGTPSKMNEVVSNVGCMSLLNDIPQLALQFAVYITSSKGTEPPKVTRVSMGLTALSVAFVLKRQYVASVERQWYKEIVRMAGVRRLTTYGGASRWLKFQKRASAAADVQAHASTSQQQLFLAWMQSMGRRQESISADAGGAKAIRDEDSEDSEDDLDSLSDSDSEDFSDAEGLSSSGSERSRSGSGSQHSAEGSQHDAASGGEEEGGSNVSGSEHSGSGGSQQSGVELQASRRGRRQRGRRGRREEPPLVGSKRRVPGPDEGSSMLGSSHMGPAGLLGYARGVVDNMSESGIVSESDIFAYARNVARGELESGVVTESSRDIRSTAFHDADVFSDMGDSATGSALMRFARNAALEESSAGGGASSASGDLLAFARQVAAAPSDSGVGSAVAASDIFGYARRAAQGVSDSGVGASGVRGSDIFAFARQVAAGAAGSEAGSAATGASQSAGGFDIMAVARAAARDASAAGSDSRADSDVFAAARRAAEDASTAGSESAMSSDIFSAARQAAEGVSRSGVGAEDSAVSDIFAQARRAADAVSQSGAGTDSAISADIFALARHAANAVSRSGVGSSSVGSRPPRAPARGQAPASGVESEISDVFAAAQRAAEEESYGGSQSGVDSDIFGAALRVAEDASVSGAQSALSVASASGLSDLFVGGQGTSARSGGSNLLAAARRAAEASSEVSHRGASSRRHVQGGDAASSVGGSDVFEAARRAADETSEVAPSTISGASSDIFAAARAAADDVSVAPSAAGRSNITSGGLSDIFAPASNTRTGASGRPAAGSGESRGSVPDEQSVASSVVSGASEFDVIAAAQEAAEGASRSGVHTGSLAGSVAAGRPGGLATLFTNLRGQQLPQPPAQQQPMRQTGQQSQRPKSHAPFSPSARSQQSQRPPPPQQLRNAAAEPSDAGSEFDFLGSARRAADEVSAVSGAESDIFAVARAAAQDVSRSGVESDIFGAARDAAAEVSRSGIESDILGTARRAAQDESQSGVSSDIFGVARAAAADVSGVGTQSEASSGGASGASDIFAAARQAAADLSQSGVGTRSGVQSGLGGLFTAPGRGGGSGRGNGAGRGRGAVDSHSFAPPSRRLASEARHAAAPPALVPAGPMAPPASPADLEGRDQPPWAVLSMPGLPPPPPPPRRRPPSPPEAAPPLLDTLPKAEGRPPSPIASDEEGAVGWESSTNDEGPGFSSARRRKRVPTHDASGAAVVGSVLQFAREVAAAATTQSHADHHPRVSSSTSAAEVVSVQRSSDADMEGLFVYRRVRGSDSNTATPPMAFPVGVAHAGVPESSPPRPTGLATRRRGEGDYAVPSPPARRASAVLGGMAQSPMRPPPTPPAGRPPSVVAAGPVTGGSSGSPCGGEAGSHTSPTAAPPHVADEAQRQLRMDDLRRRRRMQGDREYKRKQSRQFPDAS